MTGGEVGHVVPAHGLVVVHVARTPQVARRGQVHLDRVGQVVRLGEAHQINETLINQRINSRRNKFKCNQS